MEKIDIDKIDPDKLEGIVRVLLLLAESPGLFWLFVFCIVSATGYLFSKLWMDYRNKTSLEATLTENNRLYGQVVQCMRDVRNYMSEIQNRLREMGQ